jgi:serine/threonine protein kinase
MEIQSSEVLAAFPSIANPTSLNDYSELLKEFSLDFEIVGYHLQVGSIGQTQGWILHISVVKSEITKLLNILVPLLASANIPFKIVKDPQAVRNLIDGHLGVTKIGKIISIYPADNKTALLLAKELITLTVPFKGPAIPTDFHLGSIVYTRYGGFSPVIMTDEKGEEVKLIYDQKGNLVKDEYTIPFSLPEGIEWPFDKITPLIFPKPKKTLRGKYRPISHLKTDPKGNVIKALYLRRLFDVRWCVIKEGVPNMWSDEYGRDMPDRLVWQKKLHDQLGSSIRLPKVLDLFSEDKKTYLALEFIKGKSLLEHVKSLNKNGDTWHSLPTEVQLKILEYALKLTHVVGIMHNKGYVHRDLTPVNFMVTQKDEFVAIDLELAFNLHNSDQETPFALGTSGYMSPQQWEMNKPSIKDDIYSLGACLINLLTGISPLAFSTREGQLLQSNLNFFIQDEKVTAMISICLSRSPNKRPNLTYIEETLRQYKNRLSNNKHVHNNSSSYKNKIDVNRLQAIITKTINGLVSPPTMLTNALWLSACADGKISGVQNEEFTVTGGTHHGLAGVLYVISRAALLGYDVSSCQESYGKGWDFLRTAYLNELPNIAPGLYGGAAGFALALISGIEAGLLENNTVNRQYLADCLSIPGKGLTIADGIAGQGMVALQCRNCTEPEVLDKLLTGYTNLLTQQRNTLGYWIAGKSDYGKQKYIAGLPSGNDGIILFLLEYFSQTKDSNIQKLVDPALSGVIKRSDHFKRLLKKKGFQKFFSNKYAWDGITGLMLSLIKAYEIFQTPLYKDLAQEMLELLPAYPATDNFYQDHGLTGLGEIYLEAYRVFKNREWHERAGYIIDLLLQTCHEHSTACYWLDGGSIYTTADFMIGSGGILHFLMRYSEPDRLGYRLLK